MAGKAGDAPASGEGGAGNQWEVTYARYFNTPKPIPSASRLLTPLPKGKKRSRGTWLTSATSASLRLSGNGSSTVVSVSVNRTIFDEHFVSSLHFSWPQVSCVPECPVRGSRALFLSYRNRSGQIQKSAVQFPTSSAAEKFIITVKDCLRDAMDIAPSGRDIACDSPPSEIVHGLPRFDGELSYERPIASRTPPIHALPYNIDQQESPLQPLLAMNIDSIFSGLPPSFTDLLHNCSTETEKGQHATTTECMVTDSALQIKGSSQSQYPPIQYPVEVAAQALTEEEADLKAKLTKYMTDSSFHDMLFKIEKVIDELGGDLSLQ